MEAMQGLVERLERAVGRLELLPAVSHQAPGDCGAINGVSGGVAPSVEAFDKLMSSMVAEFLKKSRILAGDVETHEYQEDRSDLVISETELKQVAYIFKCDKSTLQIKGKINSITIDNCKKFGLVFDNVVGIVEVINSKDIQMQVMGRVPTISINKTEGCHIYLSEDALDCEIVSAKSSEMNILIPQDGDYREFPIPEQFKTAWDGSKLVTEPAEIMG
uniref:Adenylyl cyclase-associated protein n=1 Tax=Pipistrellus kuhlii TaxID=59472 RepID=A0A7J8A5X6_PIPKU|nr:cyclase associated actin cytoskeleton regulatory protein 2 [Pipistrellus kuhlii]